MTLRSQMAADMEALLNTDEFGEAVTYTPAGGSPKAIQAIINRDPMKGLDQGGVAFQGQWLELTITNDADRGVTSVKEGLDTVSCKLKEGDSSNTTLVIARIIKSDAGAFLLEARK